MLCACPIIVALPYTIGCNFRRIVIFTQRRAVAVMWNWSSPSEFLYPQVSPIRLGPSALSPPLISVPSRLDTALQGKTVYAAIRAGPVVGSLLPSPSSCRSFLLLFLSRVPLVNTGRSAPTRIRYMYLLFLSQDFCVPV